MDGQEGGEVLQRGQAARTYGVDVVLHIRDVRPMDHTYIHIRT